MNNTRILSPAADALVDRIRAGDPAAIAPEAYGLDRTFKKEPAVLVLELISADLTAIAREFDPPLDPARLEPRDGETFGAWHRRVDDDVGGIDLCADCYSTAAYTAIGYDWVDWVWLNKGQNTLMLRQSDRAEISTKQGA